MTKPKARLDPLLAQIVAKLPSCGSPWPAESRTAWLKMMAMAFDVAYGPVGEIQFGGPVGGGMRNTSTSSEPLKPARYMIDASGYARDPIGARIMPKDVVGRLYDERGELGDLGAIVWADGSTGVLGTQLDISPA